jgi:hypothetical protein
MPQEIVEKSWVGSFKRIPHGIAEFSPRAKTEQCVVCLVSRNCSYTCPLCIISCQGILAIRWRVTGQVPCKTRLSDCWLPVWAPVYNVYRLPCTDVARALSLCCIPKILYLCLMFPKMCSPISWAISVNLKENGLLRLVQ